MAQKHLSLKRIAVDKTNATIVAVTAAAAFVTVFSLVASASLFSQMTYQNRIIGAKKVAVGRLKQDIQATGSLTASYQAFVSAPQNLIGGSPSGSGAQDGDNAKIVLDGLPSKYDFPALTSSLEKIVSGQNVTIQSITGTDDEVAQSSSQPSSTSQPVAMPFQLTAVGNYTSLQNVISVFERSIRPFQTQILEVSGDQNNLTLNLSAKTFYQPAKTFDVTGKVVR